jgi:hypothetical protein
MSVSTGYRTYIVEQRAEPEESAKEEQRDANATALNETMSSESAPAPLGVCVPAPDFPGGDVAVASWVRS